MTKERPVLFSAPMVRALLAGTKTQTRRVIKHQPEIFTAHDKPGPFVWFRYGTGKQYPTGRILESDLPCVMPPYCPYGAPGDRLWCKEVWRPKISHHCTMDTCDCADVNVTYKADDVCKYFSETKISDEWNMPKAAKKSWVSPLFMPRWASRLTLEIVSVRVERLQDISEEDVTAEGVKREQCRPDFPIGTIPWRGDSRFYWAFDGGGIDVWTTDAREAYRELWESIKGAGSWAASPWVWVIEFKRVD